MEKYEADVKAGHSAAEYWKGQADVYAMLCALNIVCTCHEIKKEMHASAY